MKLTDAQLREAAHAAAETLATGFTDEVTQSHDFSPEFERKMDALTRKMRRRPYIQALQRVAAFFLAFLAAGGIWLSADVAARGQLPGWAQEIYDSVQKHFYYVGSGEEAVANVKCYLAEIPEGYELRTDNEETIPYTVTRYTDQEGRRLVIMCMRASEDVNLFIPTEGSTEKTVSVNGVDATLFYFENGEHSNAILWVDPETKRLICLDAWFPEEEIIKMTENLIIIPAD